MFDDICYKKSFLKEVITRIDFTAPIPSLSTELPSSLAKGITKFFPIHEPTESIARELEIGFSEGVEQIQHRSKRSKQWNYFGKNREKKLILTSDCFLISYKEYSSYESLFTDFSEFLSVFTKCFPDTQVGRFGLRYINQIEVEKLKPPTKWNKFISDDLTNMIDFFDDPESLTRLFHLAEMKENDLSIKFQFGMANPDYPATIKRPHFVLDFDITNQIAHDFSKSFEYMNKAHFIVQKLFERSIKDPLREVMNGKSQ
jgi:uncharacterized protein (TIGR04255 family)